MRSSTPEQILDEARRVEEEHGVEAAIAFLDEARTQVPDSMQVVVALASAHTIAGHYSVARDLLRTAQARDPSDEGQRELVVALRLNFDVPDAIVEGRDLVARAPLAANRRVLAMALLDGGEPVEGATLISELLAEDPTSYDLRTLQARALCRLGRHREALSKLDLLLGEDGTRVLALLTYAESAEALGRIKALGAAAARAHQAMPFGPDAIVCLARAALSSGAIGRAQQLAVEALGIHPRHPGALNVLGLAALSTGDVANAERAFSQAVESAPWSGIAQGTLAQFLLETGRGEPNLEELERAAVAHPYLGLPVFLAGIYLQHRPDIDRARKMAQLAVDAAPDSLVARTRYAQSLMVAEQWALGVSAFRNVLEIDPHSVEGHYGLAVALSNLGDLVEAAEQVAAALAIDPLHVPSHELKQDLAQR